MSENEIRIHEIGGYLVRNYILETPLGLIVIDTGYAGGYKKFMKRFQQRWELSDIKYIFLTHHHDDHTGFLGKLLAATEAKVILHYKTLEFLPTGKNRLAENGGYLTAAASLFSRIDKDPAFPPVELESDRAIVINNESGQVFEDMGLPVKILFLPGHTGDSIGLFLSETGALLCGDAAMNAFISKARHALVIDDAEEFGRSWDKMLSFNPKRIYPSHGNPFEPQDLIKYRHYLDGKELIKNNK